MGIIFAIANGLVYPIFSIFLARIFNALYDLDSGIKEAILRGRESANNSAQAFLILAVLVFIFTFFRDFLTCLVGDEITTNIRKTTFKKILNMPVYWFDRP
jgi:ABC-type multidrug transport system fused ATPase/permease subunit